MTLCVQGLSNGDIALLALRQRGTIKTHLHNVYRKLGWDPGGARPVRRQNGVI